MWESQTDSERLADLVERIRERARDCLQVSAHYADRQKYDDANSWRIRADNYFNLLPPCEVPNPRR